MRRVFDGQTLFDQPTVVVVEDGRIASVSPTAEPVEDVTLLPGLIDSHTHLAFPPGGDIVSSMTSDDDSTVLDRMRTHFRQALRAGITTVRDLGDRGYLGLRLRAEEPGVLVAGPPITSPGGHCWFLGGEAIDVKAAVEEHIARGVDVIKVMATGGSITPGSAPQDSQFTADELHLIVRTAHAAGRLVAAHAHGGQGIADAVQAGVDVIEHCTFLTPDGTDPDWATIDAIAAAGTFVGVTVGGTKRTPRLDAVRAMYGGMRRAGVRLVCASDAGVGGKAHDALPSSVAEFVAFTECTPIEGLQAVTSLAAEACGISSRKGRIAAGYEADLLVVAGDPTRDLAALITDVRAVFSGGRRVVGDDEG
ncbi:amidohydrolase family protein [Actinocrispum sp. NPDC049592]|uniref:metal-dependent hydrolase family protein n=1 Tax=Actinocrispum sp. NPDC049592 TaxID=3154835 RepID=UPI003413629C